MRAKSREAPVSAKRSLKFLWIGLLGLTAALVSIRAIEDLGAARADGTQGKAYVGEAPPDMALADTDVTPESARVLLDGADVGDADAFDGHPGYLAMNPGQHTLEFRHEGYQTLQIEIEALPGRKYDIYRKMHKGKSNEIRKETWVNPR